MSPESAKDKQARLTQVMNRAAEEVFAERVTPSPASQGEPDPKDEVPRRSSPHELVVTWVSARYAADHAHGGTKVWSWRRPVLQPAVSTSLW